MSNPDPAEIPIIPIHTFLSLYFALTCSQHNFTSSLSPIKLNLGDFNCAPFPKCPRLTKTQVRYPRFAASFEK